MSNSKLLLAFLGGAALGAIIGIMVAPDSGSEFRKDLKAKAKDLADAILAKAEEIVNEAEAAATKARADAAD